MTSLKSRSRIALLAVLALGAAPALAVAQDRVPTREANIWDWRHHEPQPSLVHREEQAAGVAPPRARQEKATDQVESLYHQLMQQEGNR
jgi:hypothetical protein